MKRIIITIILPFLAFASCKKYLDVKSNGLLSLPDNLSALQGLLVNTNVINSAGVISSITSCDDYYLTPSTYALGSPVDKNMYIWEKTYPGINSGEWADTYGICYYANAVLENIGRITIKPTETEAANIVKGTAFFIRARANMELVFAFAKGYDAPTASTEPGIPLRLTTDFNQKDFRSSVEACYRQIISDLKSAIPLLPKTAVNVLQPSKPAAFGMLARVYLSMRDYENCLLYADSSLKEKSDLVDYNTVVNASQPFPLFHMPEIEYSSGNRSSVYFYEHNGLIDSTLVQSYDSNDLRRSIFLSDNGDNTYSFSYRGFYFPLFYFDGMATDEVYLMRSECYARHGDLVSAMNDLNTLLKNRYSNAMPYVDRTASTKEDALVMILKERRKELLFRGLRWMDLKRLNLEGENITLKRVLGDSAYTLPPNSPRYAIPIPDDVIKLSGMTQNQY